MVCFKVSLTFINYILIELQGTHLSPGQLNELVFEQWLMAEIQESSRPCLPEGLGNRDICKLEGNFNLQVINQTTHNFRHNFFMTT